MPSIPQRIDNVINWILLIAMWAGTIVVLGATARAAAWLFCLGYGCEL